jgi:putative exporter of polyketide antibiotics
MSVALAFVAVGQVSAARKEESSGQLDNLLVRPFSRSKWIGERIALGAVALFVGGLLAGFATWVGAVSDHAHVQFTSMLGAGINVCVPALVVFGVGVFTLALAPRWVNVVAYGTLAWFFLVEIVGGAVGINHWILDLSAFHQMTAAPATPVDWTTNAVMTAIALSAAGVGVELFRRRDLQGD